MKPAIASTLAGLNRAELEEVIKWCKGHISVMPDDGSVGVVTIVTTNTHFTTNASDEDFVLNLICEVCKEYELDLRGPMQLRKSGYYKSFYEKVPGIMLILNMSAASRIQQRSLMWLGLTLLMKAWKPDGTTMNATYFMNNLHRIPGLFDLAFPGYAAAGMLSQVTQKMVTNPMK